MLCSAGATTFADCFRFWSWRALGIRHPQLYLLQRTYQVTLLGRGRRHGAGAARGKAVATSAELIRELNAISITYRGN